MSDPSLFLTEAEQKAMDLTVELVRVMGRDVIGNGDSRDGDLNEMVAAVHIIQRMILSNVVSRALPDKFRPLGGVIAEVPESQWVDREADVLAFLRKDEIKRFGYSTEGLAGMFGPTVIKVLERLQFRALVRRDIESSDRRTYEVWRAK